MAEFIKVYRVKDADPDSWQGRWFISEERCAQEMGVAGIPVVIESAVICVQGGIYVNIERGQPWL